VASPGLGARRGTEDMELIRATHKMRRKYKYTVFQETDDTLFMFFDKMKKRIMSSILITAVRKILKIFDVRK